MQNDASAGSQLTERCAALHARLMTIRGFAYYDSLAPVDTLNRVRPVGHLWDVFSLGISLCYLFDLLPEEDGFNKINRSHFIPEHYDSANPEHGKKHAIALFAMQIRTDKVTQKIPGCEIFTVTDLLERNSTDGLLKVIATVTAIVNHLPPSAFEPNPAVNPSELGRVPFIPSDPTPAPAYTSEAQETARKNCINEIVETERKYVKDLEAMHKYVAVLSESKRIDEDTRRRLFANIDELLYFQRKFLIRLERTAGLEWQDQRWGQNFLEAEKEFSEVYAPYCANYTQASELVVTPDLQHNLASLNHLIDVKGELPAFIKKPVGRVCKYPLLVEFLIKTSSADSYQHYEELKNGLQAAKRVADKINEAHRKAENEETVKSLRTRVDDWKGLNLDDLGELLLDDTFVVTRSDADRECHVFLFEKLMLLCKEVHPNKNIRTRNSRTTPLLIKGRIFVSNITQATPSEELDALASSFPKKYTLAVWWKGDDSLQSFTLSSRSDYRMKQWESQIHQLIEEPAKHAGSANSEPYDGSGFQDAPEQDPLVPSGTHSGGERPSEPPAIPNDTRTLQPAEIDHNSPSTTVKVNVLANNSVMFVIEVPWTIEYDALVEKIQRKLRLCGTRPSDGGPLQLRYKDEDGDMIALATSEDVQMALEECRPGEQLTIHVR